jgi:uncharacterized membrane protein YbhN (UPF0104 family)
MVNDSVLRRTRSATARRRLRAWPAAGLVRDGVTRLLNGPARYLLAIGLTAGALWLLLRGVNLLLVAHTIVHARLRYLAPLLGLCVLRYWLRAVRWRVLVGQIRAVTLACSFSRVILSQAADRVLPFQLGYLVTVQITSVKFQIGRFQLFGADLTERMMDGSVFALFLALAVTALSVGRVFTGLAAFMLVGTSTGFMLAWLATRRADCPLIPSHWLLARLLCRFLEGLRAIRNPRRALAVFALTLLVWSTEAVLYAVAGLAFGLHIPPLGYVLLVSASNIGGSVPFVQTAIGFVFVAQQALMAVHQSLAFATAYALSIEAALIVPIVLFTPVAAVQLGLHMRDLFPARTLGTPGSAPPALPRSLLSTPRGSSPSDSTPG